MFRIRRIYDVALPRNARALAQAQGILKKQFPGISDHKVAELPQKLQLPYKDGFVYTFIVADDPGRNVRGFALISQHPELGFTFLDYLAAAVHGTGGGVGSALYEAVREEALELKSVGVFFECFPDDPALCKDLSVLRQNVARLRFYERYRAYPIVNTAYETRVVPEEDNPPYLVFDGLDQGLPVAREKTQAIVRTILESKYKDLCSSEYIDNVVNSFNDDPVQLREPRYITEPPLDVPKISMPAGKSVALVVNDQHIIHHVRERGYVESPVRIQRILQEIGQMPMFRAVAAWHFPERYILAVHDREYVTYLKKVCERLDQGQTVYPYVFPIRNQSRRPEDLPTQVGYYCIDTFTPINRNAHLAARQAVDCTLTAAEMLLDGFRLAYALVRPPGHHAEKNSFGGFCYFNNAAIAAQYLTEFGRVAILDIDYHHGNGTQNIFYNRGDILTISIHGHPRFAYPYFAGFEDETGEGEGKGLNINYTMPEQVDGEKYRLMLRRALKKVAAFNPTFLVVAFGLDTAKGDPTGTWSLKPLDFELNGRMLGNLRLHTLIVQEGGYKTRELGRNAGSFFRGLWDGMFPNG
jgi:acetoin utilization deacetylase AcuC-like enzyme